MVERLLPKEKVAGSIPVSRSMSLNLEIKTMSKSIQELSDIVKQFCEDRDWKHGDPNQLLSSISIEFGELAENYQWQNSFKEYTEEERKEIGYEFVDVLFYIFRLADKSGIDIEKYFMEKLPKLEEKFPIGQKKKDYKKIKEEYRKTGKNKDYD